MGNAVNGVWENYMAGEYMHIANLFLVTFDISANWMRIRDALLLNNQKFTACTNFRSIK
jgi:hypothetical protein